MTNQQHKTLTVGDIRQDKDEVKSKLRPADNKFGHPLDAVPAFRPTNLIGHAILASDLIAFEYRRPL